MESLFDISDESNAYAPLADRMRPEILDDIIGQDESVGKNSFLYKMIERDTVPSLLLFGPPGCGKTTIASVIAKMTKFKFLKLNATSSGAKEIRDIVPAAQKNCSTMEEELLYSSMKFTDLIGHSRIYYCLMWKMGLSY